MVGAGLAEWPEVGQWVEATPATTDPYTFDNECDTSAAAIYTPTISILNTVTNARTRVRDKALYRQVIQQAAAMQASALEWKYASGGTVTMNKRIRWETNCTVCDEASSWDWHTKNSTDTFYDYLYRDWAPPKPVDPKNRLQQIIKERSSPLIITSRKSIDPTVDPREIAARQTLRRILGERDFRRFLVDGFISVRAKSGKVYQIYPGHGITRVYFNGEQIERLCVVFRGDFPPTDSVIMRYLLILNDEADFRSHAIVHKVFPNGAPKAIDQRPLTVIFDEIKTKNKPRPAKVA